MNNSQAWIDIGVAQDIPKQGARRVQTAYGELAVFRTTDDQIFALENSCPHKQGPLSEGIVHGNRVTCPLHNWVIELATGDVVGPDEGCAKTVIVHEEEGRLFLSKTNIEQVLADKAAHVNMNAACAS